MGLSSELPVSSVLPDTNVPKESNAGTGRLHSHCSGMEEPALVSSTPIHAHRTSSAIASGSENPETPRDRQDSPSLLPEEVPVSCMENFRESLQSKNNKKRSHTQLDSRKQVIAFQDRVITL